MNSPSSGAECAYCRRKIRTPFAYLETRPGVLVKIDGSKWTISTQLLVCLGCNLRLKVDRPGVVE